MEGPGDSHGPALAVTPVSPTAPILRPRSWHPLGFPRKGTMRGFCFPQQLSLDLSRQSLNPKRQLRRG